MPKLDDVIVWGGFGEKKSNKGTQWYKQDRVYDSDGLSPALTSVSFWIVVKKENEDEIQ